MSRQIWSEIIELSKLYPPHASEEFYDLLESKYTISEKKEKKNLIYPFDSPEFMNIWNMLIQEPKWRKKSHRALQASLKFLSNYSQSDAIEIMESSIRNGYQGLFELNKKQNGTKNNSIKGITDTADRILSEFARQNNSGRD